MAKMGFSRGSKILDEIKRPNAGQVKSERPTKRLKSLLHEEISSDEDDKASTHGNGVPVRNDGSECGGHGFKVNLDFAKRFEYNKRREELHKRE